MYSRATPPPRPTNFRFFRRRSYIETRQHHFVLCGVVLQEILAAPGLKTAVMEQLKLAAGEERPWELVRRLSLNHKSYKQYSARVSLIRASVSLLGVHVQD